YFTDAEALTYSTLFISFYNIKLKLNLIKSFFLANFTKLIPLTIVLLNNK
ncbi:hypothetical protein CONLIGDRAFT_578562, partial [Coniochaeta ligniaria NRRL 30616]